jgi:hypothetical protein
MGFIRVWGVVMRIVCMLRLVRQVLAGVFRLVNFVFLWLFRRIDN